jgi:hypothetical protein
MPLPPTGMPSSDLDTIRTKVRRLTRSPSTSQLSTTDIDQYINTFLIFDLPQQLRLFDLRTTITFYTKPFIDVYDTNTTDPTDPLYDFKNKYVSIHQPVYIAGYQQFYTQSREQFFGIYPQVNSIASIGISGDGIQTAFSGFIPFGQPPAPMNPLLGTHILQNNVLFSSVDINGNGLALHDVPASSTIGTLVGDAGIGPNFINYITGQFSFVFSNPPAAGIAINSQTIPYQPALPQAVLFYEDKFTIRPVPDQPYRVNLEAYVIPTVLLANNQAPEIQQWWQYIAYGAAKKVFEDRMDTDSIQQIMPEFKTQERLIIRKTIMENTNERASTIYTEQVSGLTSGGFGWGSGLI